MNWIGSVAFSIISLIARWLPVSPVCLFSSYPTVKWKYRCSRVPVSNGMDRARCRKPIKFFPATQNSAANADVTEPAVPSSFEFRDELDHAYPTAGSNPFYVSDRHCRHPDITNGTPNSAGRIHDACLCSADVESLGDTEAAIRNLLSTEEIQTAVKLSHGTCCATFRDAMSQLQQCGGRLDQNTRSGKLVHWLPRQGSLAFFCGTHGALLKQHKICPYCNEFFQEGNIDFTICRRKRDEVHLYHLTCEEQLNMTVHQCPHCLSHQQDCIAELYTGQDGIAHFGAKPCLPNSTDFRMFLMIPDGRGGFFSHSGPVAQSEVDELQYVPVSQINSLTRDAVVAALPQLNLVVLLAASRHSDLIDATYSEKKLTLLHVAANEGKVCALLLLHKFGLDIEAIDSSGETPLISASKQGHLYAVECLIKLGSDVNKKDQQSRNALHWSAVRKSTRVMLSLLLRGIDRRGQDDVGFPAVFYALSWITEPEFRDLIRGRISLTPVDKAGWTVMHWVAFLHRNDLVNHLLNLELAYICNEKGETPLHVAIRVGNVGFVEILLEARPPLHVNDVCEGGYTPYGLAAEMVRRNLNPKIAEKAKQIIEIMERLMPAAILAPLSRGEICGDISKGVNFTPIPCYNFVNNRPYPNDVLYSNAVVAFLEDDPEDSTILSTDHCKLASGSCHGLEFDGCCSGINICPLKPPSFFCDADCEMDGANYHYTSQVINELYVPFIPPDEPTSLLWPAKMHPISAHTHRLRRRLRQQATSRPELADDLLHILDLVDIECPRNVRLRRCRSADSGSRKWRKTSTNGLVSRRKSVPYTTPVKVNPSHIPKITDERNPIDLFDEIEKFDFSRLICSAVLRFERLHPLERWDLSVLYANASQRHALCVTGTDGDEVILVDENPIPDKSDRLMGCSIKCECGVNCPKRIWQQPSTARMALVYVNDIVRWGVIALTDIWPGQFLADYTGEVTSSCSYKEDSYLYELSLAAQKKDGCSTELKWNVDARKTGSIARYFNHSCLPSAKTLEVFEHGMPLCRLCVVAMKKIRPGESITIDYGDAWWQLKMTSDEIFCCCGQAECRYPEGLQNGPKKITTQKQNTISDLILGALSR